MGLNNTITDSNFSGAGQPSDPQHNLNINGNLYNAGLINQRLEQNRRPDGSINWDFFNKQMQDEINSNSGGVSQQTPFSDGQVYGLGGATPITNNGINYGMTLGDGTFQQTGGTGFGQYGMAGQLDPNFGKGQVAGAGAGSGASAPASGSQGAGQGPGGAVSASLPAQPQGQTGQAGQTGMGGMPNLMSGMRRPGFMSPSLNNFYYPTNTRMSNVGNYQNAMNTGAGGFGGTMGGANWAMPQSMSSMISQARPSMNTGSFYPQMMY